MKKVVGGNSMCVELTHIDTGIDRLKRLVDKSKKISATNAAKHLNVSRDIVMRWSELLEDVNEIKTDSNFIEIFLVSKEA